MALVFGGFVFPFTAFVIFYLLTYIALKSKGKIFRSRYKYVKKEDTYNNKFDEMLTLTTNNFPSSGVHLKSAKNKPRQKNSEVFISNQARFQNSISSRENKLAKSICLVFIAFVFSWLPYALITILAQFGSNIQNYITPYTTSLPALFAKFSSVYNPVLYVLTNNDCKNYIKKMIKS